MKGNAMIKETLVNAAETMMRVNRMHRDIIDARVKEIGMHRTQHRILMRLSRCGTLPSQKELAGDLAITPAAVTCALKKIEQDGYIERTLGQDTRYNEIKITEKGVKLVETTRRMFAEADASMFDGFTDDEMDAYIASLEKIYGNLLRIAKKEKEI